MTIPLPNADTVFPRGAEQERVAEAAIRYRLLREDADDLIAAHIRQYVSDRADTWGPPITDRNPVASICAALSTPGHYGRTPTLLGGGATLDVVRGLLSDLWPIKQTVEYLAAGIGACAYAMHRPADLDRITYEIVPPHELWADPHPSDPREPVTVRHLRVRHLPERTGKGTRAAYCWDVWTLRYEVVDGETGAPAMVPAFYVCEALTNGEIGHDVTQHVLGYPALVGDAYPCWHADGRAFLPYVIHRTLDDGTMWGDWRRRRGSFRGTLNAALLETYKMKAARDSTGEATIVSGVKIRGAKTRQVGGNTKIQVLDFEPGAIIEGEHEPGVTPWAHTFGAGAHLEQLAALAKDHVATLAIDFGLSPSDAVRAGNDPMSGVAIHLTNAQKRQEQYRQEPLCRKADKETIGKVVSLALAGGLLAEDPGPIDVHYHEIDASPEEERAERDEQEWSLRQGLVSPVDVYIERHPGTGRDVAVAELVRIATDTEAIKRQAAAVSGQSQTAPLLVGQMSEARAMIADVAAGRVPRDAGIAYIATILQKTPEEAERLLGSAGGGFVPTENA